MNQQRHKLIFVCFGMLLLLGVPALTALAQGFGLNRFQPLAAQEITLTPPPGGGLLLPSTRISAQNVQTGVIRSRPVEINFGMLAANNTLTTANTMDLLTFNLFEDAVVTSQKISTQNSTIQNGAYVWVGNVLGDEYGQAILAVGGGQVEGFIQTRDAMYQITWSDGGQVANQLDPARFVSLVDDAVIPPARPNGGMSGSGVVTIAAANVHIIDVLVVYSDDARLSAGGTTQILNAIDAAVAATNQAYLNSDINQRVRLATVPIEVAYTETGNMNTDLNRVTFADGILDNVMTQRNNFNADLVTFITDQATGVCGLGWLFTPPINSSFYPYGYNVVLRDCLAGGRTFAHELGHNMGAAHDVANAGGAGAFSYSYGYRDPQGRFRDLMAYSNGCASPCPSLNYFSNVTRKIDNRPIGSASANNALTLNNTAAVVASFEGGSSVPVAPTVTPNSGVVTVPSTPVPTAVSGTCNFTVGASDTIGLVSAINSANGNGSGNDNICLTNSIYSFAAPFAQPAPVNDYGSAALPRINTSMTFIGNGATITRTGAAAYRLFYIEWESGSPPVVNFDNVRITNGRAVVSGQFSPGGAIFNSLGNVTIADSFFSDNIAEWGGAIYNWGPMRIIDSVFIGNSGYYGGAISVGNGGSTYQTNILYTVFQENSAELGGAIYADSFGGTPSEVQVSVDGSCFIRNHNVAVDVDNDDPAQDIVATGNWWNSSNGPGFWDGSKQAGDVIVTDEVTFAPFVTVLPDFCDLPAPFDGAAPLQNYFTTATQTLTWTKVTWAQSYFIQISTSPTNFTSPPVAQTVIGESFNANLGDGTYYWRVAACQLSNGTSCAAYSAVETFTVNN